MGKRGQHEIGGKAKAGRALLWVGSLVLLGEAAFLSLQLEAFWHATGAETLGWVAGLGAVAQKAVTFLVWNDGLLLAAAAKVLVLCCPLLAIAVGIGLLRGAQYAAELDAARATAEEERR